MSRGNRLAWVGIGLLGVLLVSQPAHAVEYRLLVASVFDTSLTSFITANELTYGASGPGLQRLETAISTGGIEWGDMPAGRPLTGVADSVARAWSGVGIHADILRGGVDEGRWDEVRWEGKPGERSIWLIKVTGNYRPQSVQRVTLESGARPVRLYPPYVFTGGSGRLAVMEIPQPLLAFSETKGNVWDKWVGKGLDLGQGIGAVIGLSANALNADLVYLVVQQGDQPTSYRAVISWADPDIDREGRNNRMRHFHHR
jgi:hypothetical protein